MGYTSLDDEKQRTGAGKGELRNVRRAIGGEKKRAAKAGRRLAAKPALRRLMERGYVYRVCVYMRKLCFVF